MRGIVFGCFPESVLKNSFRDLGTKRKRKGSKRERKGSKREPKGAKREPKGVKRRLQGDGSAWERGGPAEGAEPV